MSRNTDPNEHISLVAAGYDAIGEAYFDYYRTSIPQTVIDYVEQFATSLQPDDSVLELGCGNGLPVAKRLSRDFHLTGVDVSEKQIQHARINVPGAEFLTADMSKLDYPPESFGGAIALYSIIHLPRELQKDFFNSIYSWLKPGGVFLATFASKESDNSIEDDWFGAPMYWSSYSAERTTEMIEETGLTVESARIEEIHDSREDEPERHIWVVARKPN